MAIIGNIPYFQTHPNDHSCTARNWKVWISIWTVCSEGFKQQTWILHICNCISNSKSLSCGLTLDIPKILWFAMGKKKNMFLVVTTDLQIFSSRSLTFSTSFMAARAAPAPETWMCHMLNCCCANALAFGMHTWSYMYLNINIHVTSFLRFDIWYGHIMCNILYSNYTYVGRNCAPPVPAMINKLYRQQVPAFSLSLIYFMCLRVGSGRL